MSFPFRTLALFGVALLAIVACGEGGGGSSTIPKVPLLAEVCISGEGKDASVYVRNLNDFEWQEVTFVLAKGGKQVKDYTLSRSAPTNWAPESQQPADPLTRPANWTRKEKVGSGERVLRLTFFSSLEGATIKIKKPFKAEWESAEVPVCA